MDYSAFNFRSPLRCAAKCVTKCCSAKSRFQTGLWPQIWSILFAQRLWQIFTWSWIYTRVCHDSRTTTSGALMLGCGGLNVKASARRDLLNRSHMNVFILGCLLISVSWTQQSLVHCSQCVNEIVSQALTIVDLQRHSMQKAQIHLSTNTSKHKYI